MCDAEVARRIHIQSEASGQDVVLTNAELSHNPPLGADLFVQNPPGGVRIRETRCE
jgi:hypothetical protein